MHDGARSRRSLLQLAAAAAPSVAWTRETWAKRARRLSRDRLLCPESECGYVYDPAKGDPDGGIPPGTAFEDLPEDWVCPVCGRPKQRWL